MTSNAGHKEAPHIAMFQLLQYCELGVAGLNPKNGGLGDNPVTWIQSNVMVPIKLCWIPVGAALGVLMRCFIGAIAMLMAGWALSSVGNSNTNMTWASMLTASIILGVLTGLVFAPPSLVSKHSYKKGPVDFTVENTEKLLGGQSLEYLDAVATFLKGHKEEVSKRMTVLLWALGVQWALFVYVLTKSLEAKPSGVVELGWPFLLLIVCGLFAVAIQGYRGGVVAVFLAAEATLMKFSTDAKKRKSEERGGHLVSAGG